MTFPKFTLPAVALLTAFLPAPNHAGAQTVFEKIRIKNTSFEQTIAIVGPKGKVLNEDRMRTTVRIDEKANRLYHLRVTRNGRRDSTVCDLATLRPLFFSAKGEGFNWTNEYGPNAVKAFADFNGKVSANGTYPVSGTLYDTFMDTYLVSLLPLKEGYQTSFNLFRSDLARETEFAVRNVIRDFVDNAAGEAVPAYLALCENAGVKLNLWYGLDNHELLRAVIVLSNGGAMIRELLPDVPRVGEAVKDQFIYEAFNRSLTPLSEAGKPGVRFSAGEGSGLAWMKGRTFGEGVIEFDVRGKDVVQRSFVGVAFHGSDNRTYEAVYFRPFNFRSNDPVRRIHAVQYVFEPDFGFQKLRDTRKDEFESAIRPVPEPTGWVHARIEVRAGRVKVYVDGETAPCLDVPTLNPTPGGQRIGYWVGNNSDGDFANLTVSPLK